MAKSKKTVLIIDDSDSQRKALVGLLELRGYQCLDLDGGEAVEVTLDANWQELGAVAMDLSLISGRRTGLETLRAIRHRLPGLPVLVFTGHDQKHAKEAYLAGATLFMQKPYATQDLICAVDSLVLMHSLRQSALTTESEREMLQAALDAMKIEVTICDAHGKVELENLARQQCSMASSIGSSLFEEETGAWIESREGDRWVWTHQAVAETQAGRKFIVKTAIDVTKRKMVDEVRQELLNRAAKSTREELIEYFADCLHDKFGYPRVRVYVGTADTMAGCTSRGMPPEFKMKDRCFPKSDPQGQRALNERRPFLLTQDDLKVDPCYHDLEKDGVTSQIQIPLLSAAGLVGLVSADDKNSAQHLTIEDVELMSFLGPFVADAIQVTDSLRDQKRREEWLLGLNEIDRPLTEGSGLQEVFETMGRTLARLVKADAGVVFIRRHASEPLRVISVIDPNDESLWGVTHPGTKGMIKQCLDTDAIVFKPNVWTDKCFIECFQKLDDGPWKEFLRQAASVVIEPIRCGTQVIGVLFLRCKTEISLDPIDERYLSGVANRVSFALAKLDEAQRTEAALIQQAKLHDLAMLTAGVAHGMRNPLATVQASLDYVRRVCERSTQPLDRAVVLEAIVEIQTATQRALLTLDRMIDWAKPHGFDSQSMNLGAMIEDLVELIRGDLEWRKIELNVSISPALPGVLAGPDPLRMALSDLFWNAAKAMEDGGQLSVALKLAADQQHLELAIADTGIGMSAEQLESLFLFNPFEPLPAGGSGLGLYLCRKVLAACQAELKAQSELGVGTTITAIFPIQQTSPQEREIE